MALVQGRTSEQLASELASAKQKIRELETAPFSDKGIGIYRTLFDNSCEGVYIFESPESLAFANPAACRLHGMSDRQLRALSPRFFLGEEGNDRLTAVWQDPESSDDSALSGTGIRADGDVFDYRASASALQLGDDLHVLFRIHDTTSIRATEEEIRMQRDLLTALFDNIPLGITVWGPDGRLLSANRGFIQITGYLPEDVADIEQWAQKAYPDPVLRSRIRSDWDQSLTLDQTDREYPVVRKDGVSIEMAFSAVFLKDGRAIVTMTDISDRNAAEWALRDSEARYRALSLATNEAVFISDKGICVETNEAATTMFGYTYDELIGIFGTDVISSATKHIVEGNMLSGFELPYEAEGVRKDGTVFPAEFQGKMFEYRGKMMRATTVRDLTKQKKAEASLRHSEERFRGLIENLDRIAVQGYDNDRRVTYWNSASTRLYGYTEEEALGRRLEDLIIPDFLREQTVRLLNDWQGEHSPLSSGEMTLCRKDGSEVHVYSSHVMNFTSRGREFFCIDIDLTDIKRMQTELIEAKDLAEAASKAKSEFLANMSHELRTPLNGIMGMLQLLETTQLSVEQLEYVHLAAQSSRRLTHLLADILDLSRIEAGKMRIGSEPLDIPETLREMYDLFMPVADRAATALVISADPQIPRVLYGDESRLRQILSNLIGNALKFTPAGEIRVEATLLPPQSPDHSRILFSISDTGIGIADEKISEIFDAFIQADGAFSRQFQGAGLGLSIVRQIVTLMDGAMSVESHSGKGTTFYVSLPFLLRPSDTEDASAPVNGRPQESPHRRALIVEDDPVNRLVLSRFLEKLRVDCDTAENADTALELLRHGGYSVIFLDIQLPGTDGVELCRHIRTSPDLKSISGIPIIALTAHAMKGDRERFLQEGMDGYLAKPLDLNRVSEILSGVAASEED